MVEPFNLSSHEPRKIRPSALTDEPTKLQKSRRQERRVAKTGGGRPQPASGGLPGRHGDVRDVADFLIECKGSDFAGFYLSEKILSKIEKEALGAGKIPALAVELRGKKKGRKRYFVVSEDVFFDRIVRGVR